jgi:hypothetical protein
VSGRGAGPACGCGGAHAWGLRVGLGRQGAGARSRASRRTLALWGAAPPLSCGAAGRWPCRRGRLSRSRPLFRHACACGGRPVPSRHPVAACTRSMRRTASHSRSRSAGSATRAAACTKRCAARGRAVGGGRQAGRQAGRQGTGLAGCAHQARDAAARGAMRPGRGPLRREAAGGCGGRLGLSGLRPA